MAREKDSIAASDEHNSRGIELADRGWLDEAIKEFKKAIDLDPNSAHAHDNLATVYAEKKLYREALAEYLTALKLEPDSATAHYNLACFLSTHGTDFAIAEYKEAIELDPEYPDAHLNLGLTWADVGRVDEAVKELGTAIELDPGDAFPRHELAALQMDEGDYRAAIAQLKEVVRLEPDNFEANLDLGICYAQKGFYAEAERAYEKARALTPDDLLLTYNMGALYALWGRPREALDQLKRAVVIDKPKVQGWLATDPMFDSLKADPEFEGLSQVQFAALGFAFVLVLLNAFFVAIEFALVKVRPTQLEALVEQGRAGAEQALAMRNRLDAWLSACQVGITLASLALGWVGEPAFGHLIESVLTKVTPDSEAAHAIAKTVSLVLTFATITFLHIVVGEQVPKTIAIRYAERTSLALAWPMRAFYFLAFPVIWFLNAGTRVALGLLGLKQGGEEHDVLHEDELRLIFANSAQAGAIESSRAELLERALSMMEKTARQVLVPRTQMKYLDLEASLEDNLQAARTAGHTWLPVVRGGLDQVEGLVNVKDLLFLLSRGELKSLGQVQRPVLFVPENVTLEQLLTEFRRRHKQVAVVVDEHGGTSGMVTISDVVAELVGNIAKLGRKVEPVRTLPGGRLELPGTVQLDDLESTLEVEFDVDKSEITTIAGYLMAKLGRVPVVGDVWVLDEYRMNVAKMEGPRVMMVRIEPKLAPTAAAPATTPPSPRPSS